MKPALAFLTILLLLAISSSFQEVQAQRLQLFAAPYLSYGSDVPNQVSDRGSMAVGVMAQGHLGLSDKLSLVINPDVEYYLLDVEDVSGFQADLNGLLMVGTRDLADEYSFFAIVRPYVGLGLAFTSVSGNNSVAGYESGSNVGLNVLAGSVFGAGTARVFIQGRGTFGDSNLYLDDTSHPFDEVAVQGGLIFLVNR